MNNFFWSDTIKELDAAISRTLNGLANAKTDKQRNAFKAEYQRLQAIREKEAADWLAVW